MRLGQVFNFVNKFDNKYINLIGTKNYTINNIFNIIKKILKIDKSKKIHI